MIGNEVGMILLLAIRLYWGANFFATGRGKLMNLDNVTKFFESLNIPAPGANAARRPAVP